jgi:hypothetical protein
LLSFLNLPPHHHFCGMWSHPPHTLSFLSFLGKNSFLWRMNLWVKGYKPKKNATLHEYSSFIETSSM